MSSKPTLIKCALLGDTHLNLAKRTDEARRVAEWIRDDAKARGVDLFGFAGDVMDGPMAEPDRAWLQGYLRSCADIAPVVVVPGNHDSRYSLERFASREGALHLETKYPIIVEPGADVHVVETFNGDIAVAGVAFPWRSEILARIGNVAVEDADRIAEDALRQVFLGMGVRVRELGLPTVALVHAAIRGSKLSDDQPARPLGLEIPAEDLAQVGASFYAVGHIHAKNEFSFGNAKIWTPTSPFFNDYGEAKHIKGYIWLELDPSIVNAEDDLSCYVTSVERVPTPVTPMILFEDKWTFDALGGIWSFATPFPDVQDADVRFRFVFSKEHEKSAKAAAEVVAGLMREHGAINVTLDPVPEPAIRSRIPELAAATTLEQKAELYRESTNAVVGDDERKILDGMVQEIQEELAQEGVSFGVQSRAVPTLKRIRGKGWLCFPEEFDIDIQRLGDLTAIVAPNESGKSLWMSLAGPGLLYGDTPNRGSLDDLSRARDAFIEGTFDMDGKEYTLGQVSNAMVKTNKGHVNLTSGGKPVLQKAGRREYSEWVAKHLLPWNQYLSLLFHSGSEDDGGRKINIIDMKDGARTELMLKVLGIEFYELIAQTARDRSSDASKRLGEAKARISELDHGQTVEYWSEEIARLRDVTRTSEAEVTAREKTLSDLRARNSGIDKEWSEYDAKVGQRKGLETKLAQLRESLVDINTRIGNNREVVDQADAIRDAHVEVDSLQQQLDNLQKMDRDLTVAESKIVNILELATQEYQSQELIKKGLLKEIAALNAVYATKASVQSTIDSIPEFEAAVRECEVDRDGALKEYEEVQAQGMSTAGGRVEFLRDGLRYISGGNADDPSEYAGQVLVADDGAVKGAADRPKLLAQAKAAWQQREQRAKEATEQLERLRREAEKMPVIVEAGKRVADLEESVRACEKELEAISLNIEAKTAEFGSCSKRIAANDKQATEVSTEIGKLKPLAARLGVLNSAEARLEELNKQQATIAADIELADEMARELALLSKPPAPVDLREHEQALSSLREAAQGVRSRLAMAESGLEDANKRSERRAGLKADADRFLQRVDRWTRIAREFGVDGLQKEEISNCGGELTSIVNELLRAGGDMDHTVDIRTERPHSRESRMIPCFEILVSDSRIDGGAPKEARRLSGYGQTVIGKALAMAMTRVGCERAGIQSCTIWFDELCGTATPDNAVRIIGMVRHFAKCLNAKIFFVDQDPNIQALADSQLFIESGRLRVA